MRVHTLTRIQNLPISREEAWRYFSQPANLTELTPPTERLVLMGEHGGPITEKRVLSYEIRVARFIPIKWTVEIRDIEEGVSFVDEQRSGPFALWQHHHSFESIPGGTQVKDHIQYALPFGRLGDVFHPWLVRPKLKRVFEFRHQALVQRFGAMESPTIL